MMWYSCSTKGRGSGDGAHQGKAVEATNVTSGFRTTAYEAHPASKSELWQGEWTAGAAKP